MNIDSNRKLRSIDIIYFIVFFFSLICLIISCFFCYNWLKQSWVLVLGWIILFFGFIPAIMARTRFKKEGGVLEGDSCLKTNMIVNKGIYRVVRNPMYLSPIVLTIGLIFISQHWITFLLAIPVMIYFYYYMIIEEKMNISKFGDGYINYMKQTPRLNIFYGLLKLLLDKKKK